ncbi:transcription-repair coupling factor [Blastochloris sulfoviridis]|uniref:Transcription-repair-coupling factor n=1 Tax=Blastochloris sulfoviridis TaxID=50712 RepID=A0A5M6HWU7_9HYPH|nr:transcription-repair coupling factor [Blastochloris sulfoviridis]KAA5600384.1 transcription-repair coupling factor [Blastochloris sulfoviridis]
MTKPLRAPQTLVPGKPVTFASVADGIEPLVAADLARATAARPDAPAVSLLMVCRDGPRMQAVESALGFFAPDVEVLSLPAWDCQPYDRASPNAAIVARRMSVLARLARVTGRERPAILLTTVNAVLQRVPAREMVAAQSLAVAPGNMVSMDGIIQWLEINGFLRSATVRDTGEYAVRGGIVDMFPPGMELPVRLDFFGDTLESIRTFDPETQRSVSQMRQLEFVPVSELQLTTESIRRFRLGYVAAFGAATKGDTLYEAISEGRRSPGHEHWLPLFHDRLDTLFDYLDGTPLVLEPLAEEAVKERFAQFADYYQARREALDMPGAGTMQAVYKPLPPDQLYLTADEWQGRLNERGLARLSPFAAPDAPGVIDIGAKRGHSFAAERATDANLFDAVNAHIRSLQEGGKTVVVATWTEGSRERLGHVLKDHGLERVETVGSWAKALALDARTTGLAILGLEAGFESESVAVLAEQDILGERLVRPRRSAKRAQNFIAEVTSLSAGDLVVHVDHGIGRFVGLKTVEAAGAPHDCLELHYAGGDRLFLPVENIELLTRYGSEEAGVVLDKLGGHGWQTRKARMKNRIREMASALIKVAAERTLKEAPRLSIAPGLADEFAARFPYEETEDQLAAIEAVTDDLAAGHPMDRLVCGDVGFGKTEVALRAAFATVMNGKQVAVVVPTTLLARQHARTFTERFKGLPVFVAEASRMVGSAELAKVKAGIASGGIDIVVGTHALLGKGISFKDLGLLIVDEEQHFGVGHKERLKQLRAEVHVLTLTATPIPRTLQLAMSGVREMSIIATPPVDRLAVRTFIAPFDPLMVREALLRERYRGGQAFYVCPRIEDLSEAKDFLDKTVPEVKVVVGHGQMSAKDLEEVMTTFYEGRADVLLSTTIVESGLDIPTANTLIIHRADMFGLAQLYQLRGRVGRSKTRAYALFTVPADKPLTVQAERRLKVLQSLDTLGAGFQLASHDLDIRGAGNLLGDEQSGHIKEVGFELYQQMLEEAVEMMKAGITEPVSDQWSPQITLGVPVTIPEDYVADLNVRLALYRRLADLDDDTQIEAVAAEMVDRFGPLPPEVDQLLKIVAIKALCRRANVEKVDAGPKGVVVAFRDNTFKNTRGLMSYLVEQGPTVKVRPDQRILFLRNFEKLSERLKGTTAILRSLAKIAARAEAA